MKVRKARRAHECYECGCCILPGYNYNYHHGIFDGSGVDYKVCIECDKLRDWLTIGQRDVIAFGELSEEVAEYIPPTIKSISDFRERHKLARGRNV